MAENTTLAPESKLYRTVLANDGAGPHTDKKQGLNCGHYENLHVEVIPTDDDPVIEVLYWSEAGGKFVQENPAAPRAAFGAGVAFTFTVQPRGRLVFISLVSGGGVGQTVIATSAYSIDHTL